MPPVTRSTTRRTNNPLATTQIPQEPAEEPPILLNTDAPSSGLIDWLSTKTPISEHSDTGLGAQWPGIFESLSAVQHRHVVALLSSQMTQFVMIMVTDTDQYTLREMKNQDRLVSTILVQKLDRRPIFNPIVRADHDAFHQIVTVYFPANLPDKTVSALRRVSPHFIAEPPGEIRPASDPMSGFLSQHHGWLEGESIYEGQRACRLVYIFEWRDVAGERLYKERQKYRMASMVGVKTLTTAWEVFDDELEYYGMLGVDDHDVKIEDSWTGGLKNIKLPYNGPVVLPAQLYYGIVVCPEEIAEGCHLTIPRYYYCDSDQDL
ncbi:hypothetical protein BJX99DRAFT_256644 [Aspergillus californicus]